MVTISDVAKAARVSPSTVSYVLSGKRPISDDTRKRVERSISSLGYRPHAGAQSLASKRTKILALVVPLRPDNNVPVVMQFVSSVATAARAGDHDVLLLTQEEGPDGLLRVSQASLVDAMIVMDIQAHEPRLPVLRQLALPCVLIGEPDELLMGLSCVDFDFSSAAALAVHHLHQLGHNEVALLGAAPGIYQRGAAFALQVVRGFEDAALQRNMVSTWQPSESSPQDLLREQLRELLAKRPDVTGLVVHNEAVLPTLLPTLQSLGRVVPDDISVVAICPDDMAIGHAVELTNIGIPTEQIGRIAVEMVLAQLNGSSRGELRLLAPHLTERASSTLARPRGPRNSPQNATSS